MTTELGYHLIFKKMLLSEKVEALQEEVEELLRMPTDTPEGLLTTATKP